MREPTIFIIEDDPVYSKVINMTLSNNGYTKVHSFSSGEEAINSLSRNPHFIVLDFSLGGLNGLDILKMIKKKKSSCEVVVLTSVINEDLAEKCIEFGALHYLEKNDTSLNLMLNVLSDARKKMKSRFWTRVALFSLAAIVVILALYALI